MPTAAQGIDISFGVGYLHPVYENMAGINRFQLVDTAQQSAFAGAAGSDYADHFAFCNVEIDAF